MRLTGNKLIITNRDRHGNRLRPGNWHERLADIAADFEQGRLVYDSKVQPCMICRDRVCVVVDRSIETTKPYVLEAVESFMHINDLTPHTEPCPKQPRKLPRRGRGAKRDVNMAA